jgi:predicted nucleotidyltransferase
MMTKQEILSLLRIHSGELESRFNVASLSLFGSTARDEATADSDIDLHVRFNGPATFRGYFDLKFYLEGLFGCDVDLATDSMIRPELRDAIIGDVIHDHP